MGDKEAEFRGDGYGHCVRGTTKESTMARADHKCKVGVKTVGFMNG